VCVHIYMWSGSVRAATKTNPRIVFEKNTRQVVLG